MRLAWRLVVWGWVAWPLLGAGPAWWRWWIAQFVVIALGLTQPIRRNFPLAGWLLVGCLAIYAIHLQQPAGTQAAFLGRAGLGLMALAVVIERGEAAWGWQAVMGCAAAQVPVMLWQAFGTGCPWPVAGGGLAGTLSRRGICATLLAMASLASRSWRAVAYAAGSAATGSFTGWLACVRLACGGRWRWALGAALAGVVAWTHADWWARLAWRLEAWGQMPLWRGGWLTGWGFLPLPGGFAYDRGWPTHTQTSVVLSDYHSALVEWIARTGIVGAVMLLGAGWWVAWRSGRPSRRWMMGLVGWVGLCQSIESNPALLTLLAVWVVWLAQHGGDDADLAA